MALIHNKDDNKSLRVEVQYVVRVRVFNEIQVKIEVVEVAPHRNSLVMSLVWPEGNKRSIEGQKGGDEEEDGEKKKKKKKSNNKNFKETKKIIHVQ